MGDHETPQTPINPQLRLLCRELMPVMEEALQPFTRYMTNLAEGKYFDPT
jgi:hypothetical protein